MPARIMIGADLVPTKSNFELFRDGDVKTLIGDELVSLLHGADFTIFNLEVPLTDKTHPIVKYGPNLIAPAYTIKGLQAVNPYFFGLANNHILDQGNDGLRSTIEILDKAGIAHAGAGKNLDEAEKPFVTGISGIKVGIYCCAEHEFSIATESTAGANPFDPLESLDHVAELKKQVDYVIVLYHGGKEHYRYPSPHLQKTCRKLVDKGADLVVCQHSHCIGAMEEWNNGIVVYGQGNFLFDGSTNEVWQTSLLIDLTITNEDEKTRGEVKYIPLQKNHESVRLAGELEAESILASFKSRSEEIKNPATVQKRYESFADELLVNYLFTLTGKKNILYRVLNKLSRYKLTKRTIKSHYDQDTKTALLNYLDCEAHRELLTQGIIDSVYGGGQ